MSETVAVYNNVHHKFSDEACLKINCSTAIYVLQVFLKLVLQILQLSQYKIMFIKNPASERV